MKNIIKNLGIIALTAIIIFSMAGCPDDNGKGGTPTFTVTFDSDGGSKVDPLTVTKGGKAKKPADPTKSTLMAGLWDKDPPVVPYTFVEWQKDGAAYDFDTPVTANITLTAQWTATTPSETPLFTGVGIPLIPPIDYSGTSKVFTLVLEEDVDIEIPHNVQGVTLTITSAGTSERVIKTMFGVGATLAGDAAKLVIDGNITLRPSAAPVVQVSTGGTLELKGNAKITGHTSSFSSAVELHSNDASKRASMTMSGNAEISGNTRKRSKDMAAWGGGVYLLENADLTMNDNAAIKNNTASDDIDDITDNWGALGGGVFISGGCTFTMNGGEISGNVAATPNIDNAHGGGVYVDGIFIVASETVKANIKNNSVTYKTDADRPRSSGPQVKISGGTFTVGGVDADTF